MQPIAVVMIHGIAIEDPDFWLPSARLLKEGFAKALGPQGPDPDDALVIEPASWAPVLQTRQQSFFDRMYPDKGAEYDEQLDASIRRLNAGAITPLAPLVASAAMPVLPRLGNLHYPTARWLLTHFVGDIIAYDRSNGPCNYAAAHEVLARALATLADRAGPEAPLCVLGHSFGSVLISDYVYDEQESVRSGRDLVPPSVRALRGDSPLARAETLSWLFTLGSPLALWSLRYDEELSRPIDVPGKLVDSRYPGLNASWVNWYDTDDIVAFPLRPLGTAYQKAVTEDREVSIGSFPLSATPLNHIWYWSDRSLLTGLAEELAEGWRRLNP